MFLTPQILLCFINFFFFRDEFLHLGLLLSSIISLYFLIVYSYPFCNLLGWIFPYFVYFLFVSDGCIWGSVFLSTYFSNCISQEFTWVLFHLIIFNMIVNLTSYLKVSSFLLFVNIGSILAIPFIFTFWNKFLHILHCGYDFCFIVVNCFPPGMGHP